MKLHFRQPVEQNMMVEMNMTPLIDVMLVLIVTLLVTIPVQQHAVNLTMPMIAPFLPEDPPPVARLDIDFDGTVYWDGVALQDRAALDGRLHAVEAAPVQPALLVHASRLAPYRTVIAALAEVKRSHVTNVVMTGNE